MNAPRRARNDVHRQPRSAAPANRSFSVLLHGNSLRRTVLTTALNGRARINFPRVPNFFLSSFSFFLFSLFLIELGPVFEHREIHRGKVRSTVCKFGTRNDAVVFSAVARCSLRFPPLFPSIFRLLNSSSLPREERKDSFC